MVQSLQLSARLTQSLVLAPQLQQSLALLQAPTLELKALIEQELQQNPVLEEVSSPEPEMADRLTADGEENDGAADPPELPEEGASEGASDTTLLKNGESADAPVDDFQQEFDRLVQLDQEWRDHFAQTNIPIRQSTEDEEKRQFMFDSLAAGTTLSQVLMDQVRETDLNEEQRHIAELIIGNIDDYGYLKSTVEEMAAATNLPVEKISEVLKVIQTFDPPGVGALDLRECLVLQLERAGRQDSLEYRIVRDFMDALGKRRIPEIARGTGYTVEEVQDALGRIGRLEPRPGRAFLPDNDQYVLPEVFVQKVGDDFHGHHQRRADSPFAHQQHLQGPHGAGREFRRGQKLHPRKNPRRKISHQEPAPAPADHLEHRQGNRETPARVHGKGRRLICKPMTMAQVAEVVGVHETTVSRAVSGKYMQTPQGMFEMKFFFTAGLQTASGDGVSNTSVKDMIAEIFKNEDPPNRCPIRRLSKCWRTRASTSRAVPSPNTDPN